MKVNCYKKASEYLLANEKVLLIEEAFNSLLLGLAKSNRNLKSDDTIYFDLTHEGQLYLTGLKTKGRDLIVYGKSEKLEYSIAAITALFERQDQDIPGFIGPKDLVRSIGKVFERAYNRAYRLTHKHMVYKLESIEHMPQNIGFLRLARHEEIEYLGGWMQVFYREAMNETDTKVALDTTHQKVNAKELYVWESSVVVSMAAVARPTNNGITVNYVYTPQEYRRKGYATKLVAELSHLMLEKGYKFCTLFADVDNPTSNNIYSKIGYKPIGEFSTIKVSEKDNV